MYTRRAKDDSWAPALNLDTFTASPSAIDASCAYRVLWPSGAESGLMVLVAMSHEAPRLLSNRTRAERGRRCPLLSVREDSLYLGEGA